MQDIGPHYATTLRRWRTAFGKNLAAVRALGFDDRFIRMWEYYLASSEASSARLSSWPSCGRNRPCAKRVPSVGSSA